jgi:hypothetical protein
VCSDAQKTRARFKGVICAKLDTENIEVDSLISTIFIGALLVVPYWVIYKKAGFHPAISVLVFVPFIGVILATLILAFVPWRKASTNKEAVN